eukprot:7504106-Pyramimonas_sp.AAC.1
MGCRACWLLDMLRRRVLPLACLGGVSALRAHLPFGSGTCARCAAAILCDLSERIRGHASFSPDIPLDFILTFILMSRI